jgi:hypothetical protein
VDPTAWVAIAGITGTLIGALAGPAIGERMRRRSARNEQLLVHRLDAYGELLKITGRLQTDASIRLTSPEYMHSSFDGDEFDRTQGRVRVIATKRVLELLDELAVAFEHYEAEFDGDGTIEEKRKDLVDGINDSFVRLQDAVRKEVLG